MWMYKYAQPRDTRPGIPSHLTEWRTKAAAAHIAAAFSGHPGRGAAA